MSTPWEDPAAHPLQDIREFMHEAEQSYPPPPFRVILPDWWPPDWPRGSCG